ncbi:MAG: N-acetyltransferase [Woeseiaceae bacterium]|nr:N-acetyltransferase [Woeseiaceae bacterium]
MPQSTEIRETVTADLPALERLYPRAFPEEDLLPLLRDLLHAPAGVLSLVACVNIDIAGHIAFTMCGLDGGDAELALLGPLAVAPERQGQGIGSAIVRAGLERLRRRGTHLVCVLGDPNYYGRFGFTPDSGIEPPYQLPPEWNEAWQSLALAGDTIAFAGKLRVPSLWAKPALWAP